jgi:hypothetical protein
MAIRMLSYLRMGLFPAAAFLLLGALPASPQSTVSRVDLPPGISGSNVAFSVTALSDAAPVSGQVIRAATANPAIKLISAPFVAANIGSPYSTQLVATGGTAPYQFASSACPVWLALTSDGRLFGTPTATDSGAFEVQITDANGGTSVPMTFPDPNWIVYQVLSPLSISPATLPNGVQGQMYSVLFDTTGFRDSNGFLGEGIGSFTGTLPAGLSFSQMGNFYLSGIPTQTGTYSITVHMSDNFGDALDRSYTLTIIPLVDLPLQTIYPQSPLNGTAGLPFSVTFSASDGRQPFVVSLVNGSLPDGLTISGGSTLSGVPTTAGTYSFAIRITDADQRTGAASYTLNVGAQVLQILPDALPNGAVGRPYSLQFTTKGPGAPPYTWSSQNDPPGLFVTTDGLYSGTPTSVGSYQVTIAARGQDGNSAQRVYALQITAPPIVLSPTTLPAFKYGVPYSQKFTASGGTAPYVFSMGYNCLPSGITLNSDGTVSGTPTVAPQGSSCQVSVKDAVGTTSYTDVTITYQNASLVLNPVGTLQTGIAGMDYGVDIGAAGGAPPYTYVVSSGSLPPGLALDWSPLVAGVSIEGKSTTAGTFDFALKISDASGLSASYGYSITITVQTITVSPTTLPDAQPGIAYSETLTASGGTPPYQFALEPGDSPPPGIFLSSSGVVSGTTTLLDNSRFEVHVTDAKGLTGSTVYTLLSQGGPITLTANLPRGSLGVPYTGSISASGGTPPYQLIPIYGYPPTGIEDVGDNGTFTGTPNYPGTYTFLEGVYDRDRKTGSAWVTITVDGTRSLTLGPDTLPNAYLGKAYSAPLTVSGGLAPYRFDFGYGSTMGPTFYFVNGAMVSDGPTRVCTLTFTVDVTDSLGDTTSKQYTIQVLDPNGPLAYSTGSLPNGVVGTAYTAKVTASGGQPPYWYIAWDQTIPPGIVVYNDGTIGGIPTTAGVYSLQIDVTDAHQTTASHVFPFLIAAASGGGQTPLNLATRSLPSPANGQSYSAPLQAIGGTPPYAFSLTLGGLPTGLTLSQSGMISGTPSATGTFNFTIQVSDSLGSADSKSFTVIVSTSSAPALDLMPYSLPQGRLASDYGVTFSCKGGTPPCTYSLVSGTLPAGVSFVGAELTGTPRETGSYSIAVKATDAAGAVVTVNYTLEIGFLTILPSELSPATVGWNVSYSLSTSPAATGTVFTIVGGGLPPGISLSPAGVISGKASAAGFFTFTVKVSASDGTTGFGTYALLVYGNALTLQSEALPGVPVNQTYNYSLLATGGTPPYRWSYSGTLPTGMSLSAGGTLGGAPENAGLFAVTIQVTDTAGASASRNFSLNIIDTLWIASSDSLPSGTVGITYSQSLEARGGVPPYKWSLLSGALPSGLGLSGTGMVAGTPKTSGNWQFKVAVTDAAGAQATGLVCISITDAQSSLTPRGVFSQVVSGGGWGSSIYLINPASKAVQASLAFRADDGSPLRLPLTTTAGGASHSTMDSQLELTLAPGSTALVVTSSDSVSELQGWAQVSGTGTVSGYEVFHYMPASGRQSEATVILEQELHPLLVLPFENADGFSTGVALANVVPADPDSVVAVAWDASGKAISAPWEDLAAGGHTAFSIADKTPAANGTRGIINFLGGAAGSITGMGIRVNPAGSFTSIPRLRSLASAAQSLPVAVVGKAYTQSFTFDGGLPPYTWSIVSGALPQGLALQPSGNISGTPRHSGAWTFTVQAADTRGDATLLTYTLPVGDGQSLTRFGVLPHIASGGGWKTTLYLANLDSQAQALRLIFRGDDGQPLSLPLKVTAGGESQTLTTANLDTTLAPNSTVQVESDAGTAEGINAWVECLGSPMINGYGVFRYAPADGMQSEATVPLETSFKPSFLLPYENTNGFTTGIGLADLSQDTSVTITATLYDENGAQLTQRPLAVAGGGHVSFSLTDKFPEAASHRGFVLFQGSDAGLITGLGVRVSPLATFTSAPRLEAQ